MDINELKNIINEFNDLPEINRHWDRQPMNYENEYIKVCRLDDSNNHSKDFYNKMVKMWSIIYMEKSSFSKLTNLQIFLKEFNAKISRVNRGENKGCYGLRIYDVKECPTIDVAKTILDFIFDK